MLLAMAEIKPVYYPGKERLVSLDVRKLYQGEDVILQNPEDIDQDQWLCSEYTNSVRDIHLRGRRNLRP